jgi:hypothetical protein
VSRDLLGATLIANGTNYTTSSAVHTAELRNLGTGAAFYILRQNATTCLLPARIYRDPMTLTHALRQIDEFVDDEAESHDVRGCTPGPREHQHHIEWARQQVPRDGLRLWRVEDGDSLLDDRVRYPSICTRARR